MITNDLLYQLSLCEVPHIGAVHAKILCETFGSALEVFRAPRKSLENIEGIGEARAKSIRQFRDFHKAEKEIEFLEKFNISSLFYRDGAFPRRLKNCYDPPILLFYKGNADLNAHRIIAVVGTRRNSAYGKEFTEELIRALISNEALIVSGLAFGIDAIAHKAALRHGGQTVAVIGHGLDTIYPASNTSLARSMIHQGGLLTEFKSKTKPDKHNFPSRNRIVAGMCDATVIVESDTKGGSIITAELAYGYNREVFAVPGRSIDHRSSGCNELIRTNKAILLQEPLQLVESMGWLDKPKRLTVQPLLFEALNATETQVVNLLKEKDSMHIDELQIFAKMSSSMLASVLLGLEMQNILKSLPGRRFRLQAHEQ